MENHFVDLCPTKPTSGTLPHDLHLSLMANGSILEESPVDIGSIIKELENETSEESSYESADDLPDGSAHFVTATPLDSFAEKTTLEGVAAVSNSEKLFHVRSLFIGIAVCVLVISLAVCLWYKTADGTPSELPQNFTSDSNDAFLNITQNVSSSSVKVV